MYFSKYIGKYVAEITPKITKHFNHTTGKRVTKPAFHVQCVENRKVNLIFRRWENVLVCALNRPLRYKYFVQLSPWVCSNHVSLFWVHKLCPLYLQGTNLGLLWGLPTRSTLVLGRAVEDDTEIREQVMSAQDSWGKVQKVGESAQERT